MHDDEVVTSPAAPRRRRGAARVWLVLLAAASAVGLALFTAAGNPVTAIPAPVITSTPVAVVTTHPGATDLTAASATPSLPPAPQPQVAALGSTSFAITVEGQIRMYRVYRPATATRLAPVVVMLAGGLGSAATGKAAYGWDALADREGFVVVYPEATGGSWNVGGDCCGLAGQRGVDDVAFVRAVLEDLPAHVSVDSTRRYAAGLGSGGMMAYRLACDTKLFSAIGVVAGTQLGDCPNPAPLSVIHVHGTLDTSVPYSGSDEGSVVAVTGRPIPEVVGFWRTVNRCGGTSDRDEGPVTTVSAQCPSGRRVTLVKVAGLGHEWPGATPTVPQPPRPSTAATTAATSTPAEPRTSLDATLVLWQFFRGPDR